MDIGQRQSSAQRVRRSRGGRRLEATSDQRSSCSASFCWLLGIVALATVREISTTSSGRLARTAQTLQVLAPPRPPLTAAEEEYALALWPIQRGQGEGALRMTSRRTRVQTRRAGPEAESRAGSRGLAGVSEQRHTSASAGLTPPASLAHATGCTRTRCASTRGPPPRCCRCGRRLAATAPQSPPSRSAWKPAAPQGRRHPQRPSERKPN